MGLQVPPFREWFCIGNLLLLVLGIGLVLGEVGADNHETQQVVKITGTVVDNDTEMPIAEVSIRVVDTQIRGTTDKTGAFSLELPSGTYKVHASAPFYNTFVITDFQVSTGEAPAPLQIKLTPQVVSKGRLRGRPFFICLNRGLSRITQMTRICVGFLARRAIDL